MISFEQELQQQLVIETRNLKKTRNFYQKLIQQERKNKGWVLVLTRRRSMKMAKCCVPDTACKDCVCIVPLLYSKGPESKPMLFKLKSQLEELRSKVAFLDSVKKYLEVQKLTQKSYASYLTTQFL